MLPYLLLALDADPSDVKARFRRAQAFQKLCRLDQAFLDTQRCAQLEPKNKAFQDLLRELGAQIQQKAMPIYFKNICPIKLKQILVSYDAFLYLVVSTAQLHRCSCAANVLPSCG